jgi:hypothetical protein
MSCEWYTFGGSTACRIQDRHNLAKFCLIPHPEARFDFIPVSICILKTQVLLVVAAFGLQYK